MSTRRDVRLWAMSKGWDVSPTGQLPDAMVDGYNAQHPDDPCPRQRRGRLDTGSFTGDPELMRERRSRGGRNAHGSAA